MATFSKSKQELIDILKSSDMDLIGILEKFKTKKFGKHKKSLLHLVLKYVGFGEMLEKLVRRFFYLSERYTVSKRRLPIHAACRYGNVDGVKILLGLSTKTLNSKDFEGNSPLALSCMYQNADLLSLLKTYPVNPLSQNNSKQTPLDICIKSQNHSFLNHFLSCIAEQKPSFFKCLQFALEKNEQNLCSLILSNLEAKDFKPFNLLYSIFESCKGNNDLIKSILEKIKSTRTIKLIILLKLNVASSIIVNYCQDELDGNSIFIANVWNRADLVRECLNNQLIDFREIERASKVEMKPEFQELIRGHLQWNKFKVPLFMRKFSDSIYSKVPLYVFRDFLKYL